MAKALGADYTVHFRRRREGKTNYAKRLAMLKSGKPRMIVRKTNRGVTVQFAEFSEKGDKVIAAADVKSVKKLTGFEGKCNSPSAFLVGMLAGKKAIAKGAKEFVLDMGLQTPSRGSVVFAALKGAVESGLKTNAGEEILPTEERISGKHLGEETQKKFQEARKKIKGG
jgi:large subunit ribosomal protein L18